MVDGKGEEKKDKIHQLTEEEYQGFITSIEDFENQFLFDLAGTDKFEIVPTIDNDGRPLSKEQLTLIKNECLRLGFKVLYKIDINSDVFILVNPETMKIGYVTEGMH